MTFEIREHCPRCGKPLTLTDIEPHPSNKDLELHNFACAACGPVKTKIVRNERADRSDQTVTASPNHEKQGASDG